MPQTLLALLALALAGGLILQRSTHEARASGASDQHEVTAAAVDVAHAQFGRYRALAYDPATASGPVTSPARLASPIPPAGASTPSDNLNGFHETTAVVSRDVGEGAVDFTVHTRVGYVAEADGETPSATPTRLKKVTLVVSGPAAPPLRLSELFMCGSRCAF